jgi:hypothetical protein
MAHKWTKAQVEKMLTTKRANAILKEAKAKPLEAHYVGETAQQPTVDVRKLEETAFRRGMFTALQMVIDALVRELR